MTTMDTVFRDVAPSREGTPLLPLDSQERFATKVIHEGSRPDPHTGAVVPAINLATTFAQTSPGLPIGPFDYSRAGNASRLALETLVAALEVPIDRVGATPEYSGADGDMPPAIAFASGTAATAAIVQALVGAGNHLISVSDVYGGTNRYLAKVALALGIQTTFVDMSSQPAETKDQIAAESDRLVRVLSEAFRPKTRMIWIETPTNPTLRLVDIAFVAKVAHSKDAIVTVDNTFASPYYQRPLEHGADVVIHSASKYIGGHSDIIMGLAITANLKFADALRFQQKAVGAVPSPFDCWLAQRGAKTLHVRMQRHGTNALSLAKSLQADPRVDKVYYHGLPKSPGSRLAWRQLSREAKEWALDNGYDPQREGFPYSGMVTIHLKTPADDQGQVAKAFFDGCKLFILAESLGGVESLAELPSVMTHAGLTDTERASLGIDHALVRLSVGIEDVRDLERDLDRGLTNALGPKP